MLKKNNLAVFAIMVIGLFSLLTSDINAQKTVSVKTNLPTISADSDILQKYIEVSALPTDKRMDKRREIFIEASHDIKAKLFRFHLAFQLVTRANLSKDQKDVILDAILVATPDSYDKSKKESQDKAQLLNLEARAKSLFEGKDGFEIFANLGTDTSGIEILKKYQEITVSPYQIERRQTFSKGTPQEKSNTMKTHLAVQIAQRELNKDQLSFVLEFESLVSPEAYGLSKKSKEWEKLDKSLNEMSDRMLNYFKEDEALLLFISLGGKNGSSKNSNFGTLCACSMQSDYCSWWRKGSNCGESICDATIGGCGTGLQYDCVGGCQTPR
jgi:hypothetical protein